MVVKSSNLVGGMNLYVLPSLWAILIIDISVWCPALNPLTWFIDANFYVVKPQKKEEQKTFVEKQAEVQEENQKAVEIDFIRQEENFRKRLASRKKGELWLNMEWGNESTIKMDSMNMGKMSPEQSIELNSSDMILGKLITQKIVLCHSSYHKEPSNFTIGHSYIQLYS